MTKSWEKDIEISIFGIIVFGLTCLHVDADGFLWLRARRRNKCKHKIGSSKVEEKSSSSIYDELVQVLFVVM